MYGSALGAGFLMSAVLKRKLEQGMELLLILEIRVLDRWIGKVPLNGARMTWLPEGLYRREHCWDGVSFLVC